MNGRRSVWNHLDAAEEKLANVDSHLKTPEPISTPLSNSESSQIGVKSYPVSEREGRSRGLFGWGKGNMANADQGGRGPVRRNLSKESAFHEDGDDISSEPKRKSKPVFWALVRLLMVCMVLGAMVVCGIACTSSEAHSALARTAAETRLGAMVLPDDFEQVFVSRCSTVKDTVQYAVFEKGYKALHTAREKTVQTAVWVEAYVQELSFKMKETYQSSLDADQGTLRSSGKALVAVSARVGSDVKHAAVIGVQSLANSPLLAAADPLVLLIKQYMPAGLLQSLEKKPVLVSTVVQPLTVAVTSLGGLAVAGWVASMALQHSSKA
eukprot:jgi/Picsp_1/4593/NSC_01963-R1_---NA---